jgi:hypothetical protein
MPKQRLQVDSGLRAPVTRPSASPVDTFVNPGANPLERLAQGLAEVSPAIGRFSSVLADRLAAEETQKGEIARRKAHEQGLTLAEAQRKGDIPAQSNPWFMAGLKEQDGRVSADTWHTDLIVALSKDQDMQTTTDIGAFDTFVNKYREGWLKEKVGEGRDQHFEVGFGHRSDAYLDEERRKFASKIEGRLKDKSDDLHFMEIKKHVRDSLSAGADLTEIAGAIDVLNDSGIRQGRDKGALNRTTVEAVAAAAVEFDDPTLGHKALDLLTQVKAGSGAVGDTKYGSETVQKARKEIDEKAWTTNQRRIAAEKQEREVRTRDILGGAVKALSEDPNASLKGFVNAAQEADLPELIPDLANLQRNSNLLEYKTDENIKRDLYSRIWTIADGEQGYVTEQTIVATLRRQSLTTEDANWLIDQLKKSREARVGKGKEIFDDYNFRQELSNFPARFADIWGNIGGADGDKKALAEATFRQKWFELHASGEAQKMSEKDKITWLSDTASSVVGRQRGIENKQFGKVPAPQLTPTKDVQKVLPKELVLTELDLRGALGGKMSPALKAQLQSLGLKDPSAVGAFIDSQLKLFKKQTGRDLPRSKKELSAEPPKEPTK